MTVREIRPFGFCGFGRELRTFSDNPITLKYEGEEGFEYCNEFAHQQAWGYDSADIILSKTVLGMHKPVLDIDIPHQYYESSTEGHGHLYFDIDLTWDAYREILEVLAKHGIIGPGYLKASIARGYTAVRLPWVKKKENVAFDVFGSEENKWIKV